MSSQKVNVLEFAGRLSHELHQKVSIHCKDAGLCVNGDMPVSMVALFRIAIHMTKKICLRDDDNAFRTQQFDDMLQLAFVAIIRAIVTFDPKKVGYNGKTANIGTWCFRSVNQAIMNGLRRKNDLISVKGDGETTIFNLCCAKMTKGINKEVRQLNRVRYNPETILEKDIREQGYPRGLEDIARKGETVFLRFETIDDFYIIGSDEELQATIEQERVADMRERVQKVRKSLTADENKVVDGIIDGLNNRQIAEKMGFSAAWIGELRKQLTEHLQKTLA